ncbi:hypothetical protein A2U01_0115670, partial [Trifolium medium]|nr:hypothetical protein [Trifolium medium]
TKCVAVGGTSPVGGKQGWTSKQMRTASNYWKYDNGWELALDVFTRRC